MPSVPRLPIVPDPLRRIEVPRGLASVTTIGEEDAGAASTSARAGGADLESAVDLYRAGSTPRCSSCLRATVQVVLDRAIGHAHGNGPADPRGRPERACRPRHAVLRLLGSKAVTAMPHPHARRARRARHRRPRRRPHPRVRPPRQGRRSRSARSSPTARGSPRCRAKRSTSTRSTTASTLVELICRREAGLEPGRLLAYHAVSGGFILGEIVHRVTGRPIRDVLAEEILDPLGFRWMNYGVAPEDLGRVGLSYITGPPLLPPLSTLVTRALGAPLDEVVELSNDPRFLTAVVPAANVVTSANELVALLRDLPPRRRARRGPGDVSRRRCAGRWPSSRASRSTSRSASRRGSATG